MLSVYKKELRSYFTNTQGAIFVAFLLFINGVMLAMYNFYGLYPNFEYSLTDTSFIFLLIVPILTMKIVAEEKHARTDQLLYSLPIKLSSVILGKYFALLTIFAIPTLIMCVWPVVLSIYGTVNFAAAYAAIFTFFCLGAALLGIGMFISSLTESQVIAGVISFAVLLLLYLMNALITLIPTTAIASCIAFCVLAAVAALIVYVMIKDLWIAGSVCAFLCALVIFLYSQNNEAFIGLFPKVLSSLSVYDRFSGSVNGVFDISAIIYYISIASVSVFLSVQTLEKKRWN